MSVVAAALLFTQNSVPGSPAQGYLGSLSGGPVTVGNSNDANVATWSYYLLDAPIGSSFASEVSYSVPVQTGSTPTFTFTFTPDVAGTSDTNVYDLSMNYVGKFGSLFETSGNSYPPHPNLVPVGSYFYDVTFDNTELNSVSGTQGNLRVFRALRYHL